MYIAVLTAHSWLRWVVLALGCALLLIAGHAWRQDRPWDRSRELLANSFIRVLDIQFTLGLTLYLFLSPISRTGFGALRPAMGDTILRFFTLEHPFGMFMAVSAAHAGVMWAKRHAPEATAKVLTVSQCVWLLITLVSIPWPIAPYGRPLFRL